MTSAEGPDRGPSTGRTPAGDPAASGWTPAPAGAPSTAALRVDGPEASSPVRTAARNDGPTGSPGADAAPSDGSPSGPRAADDRRPDGSERSRDGDRDEATTVLPGASVLPGAAPGGVRRPQRPAASSARSTRPAESAPKAGKGRRARLAVQRIDPWSVFTYTLLASLFLGVALVVMVFALYAVLGSLGVTDTVNELYLEVNPGGTALFTSGRFVGGAAVLAAVNVVLLTLLTTLGTLLYNLIASFTGGIEVTLGDRDA